MPPTHRSSIKRYTDNLGTGWYPVRLEWLKFLSPLDIMILGKLCNVSDMTSAQDKDDPAADGWFLYSHQRMVNDSGMSLKYAKACSSRLLKLGIINYRMTGNPARRQLKIDYTRLHELTGD